jgi:hypothetical protein
MLSGGLTANRRASAVAIKMRRNAGERVGGNSR